MQRLQTHLIKLGQCNVFFVIWNETKLTDMLRMDLKSVIMLFKKLSYCYISCFLNIPLKSLSVMELRLIGFTYTKAVLPFRVLASQSFKLQINEEEDMVVVEEKEVAKEE